VRQARGSVGGVSSSACGIASSAECSLARHGSHETLCPPSLTTQLLPGESLFGAVAVYVAAVAAGHATSALQLNLPPLVGMLLAGTYMRTLSTLSMHSPKPSHPLTPPELALQPAGVPNALSPTTAPRRGVAERGRDWSAVSAGVVARGDI
jgi:hypothetical protein